MDAQEIVERIMTCHWDLAACQCWICQAGDRLGFGCRAEYLQHHHDNARVCPDPADWKAMGRAICEDAEAKEQTNGERRPATEDDIDKTKLL